MGTQDMRFVRVTPPTLRKAKVLSAAFGVPIYAIFTQAVDEMAENYKMQVIQGLEEVKDEQVQGRRGSKRHSAGT